jgi:ATP-dependent helicase/nuclease subunit A
MAWLRAADTEVKRDMEISRDEVRVMTVHGAKGLEASVVFLADTVTSPADTERLSLIRMARGNAPADAAGVTVWAGRKAEDPPCVAQARADMIAETEHEYRRLLYVAMTRAADRLIVGGCMPGNRKEVRDLSWYDLIGKGLEKSGLAMQEIETATGTVKRYSRPGEDASAATGPVAETIATQIALPPWLHAKAAPAVPANRSLRPSEADDTAHRRIRPGETTGQRNHALVRGTLVHRLLQSLPDMPADRRRNTALAHLARNASGWSEAERDGLAIQVLSLIDDARFAPVFASGSRAEVAIAGRLTTRRGDPVLVSGQIDRLVVTPEAVLIVDYKTGHAPPASEAEVPPAYVRQLALYRAVLARLYPQLPVRAALLWTEAPELMEISAAMLDAELEALISA